MEYLIVFEQDGGNIMVVPGDESRIDAGVTNYLETGRDSLLMLTTLEGTTYKVLASQVLSWLESNPTSRARRLELEKQARDEENENRSLVGLPWSDE